MRVLRFLVYLVLLGTPTVLAWTVIREVWPAADRDMMWIALAMPCAGLAARLSGHPIPQMLGFALGTAAGFVGVQIVVVAGLVALYSWNIDDGFGSPSRVLWFAAGLTAALLGFTTIPSRRRQAQQRRERLAAARDEGARNAAEFIATLDLPDETRRP
ncbi:MAG: hypothetical protein J7518_02090 [Nocardioidaceae bacterium]|nr:hypothetical protein [Nocardioidaceae bacterium]